MVTEAEQVQRDAVRPREVPDCDSQETFDRIARKNLNMSGAEFVRRWDAKAFGDDPDSQPRVMRVAMLMALVR